VLQLFRMPVRTRSMTSRGRFANAALREAREKEKEREKMMKEKEREKEVEEGPKKKQKKRRRQMEVEEEDELNGNARLAVVSLSSVASISMMTSEPFHSYTCLHLGFFLYSSCRCSEGKICGPKE